MSNEVEIVVEAKDKGRLFVLPDLPSIADQKIAKEERKQRIAQHAIMLEERKARLKAAKRKRSEALKYLKRKKREELRHKRDIQEQLRVRRVAKAKEAKAAKDKDNLSLTAWLLKQDDQLNQK